MGFRMFRIGRTPIGNNNIPNEIQIDHPTVSRSHLSVFINDENEVFITDLDSANGTFVNGNRITGDYQLKAGDILKLGVAPPIKWTKWLEEDLSVMQSAGGGFISEDEEQVDTKTELNLNKKKSFPLIKIGILVLILLVAGVAVYFLIGNKTSKPLTKALLEKKSLDEIKGFAKNKDSVVDIKNGDTLNLKGKVYILTVENGRLQKIEEKVAVGVVSGGEEQPIEPGSGNTDSAKVDSSKVVENKPTITTQQQQTDIKFMDDRDNDGIADDEDRCPDDPKNKCLPKDVRRVGNGIYETKVLSGGEYLDDFFDRINSRADIKALGVYGKISAPEEIIEINGMQATLDIFLDGGEWVKFKVK